MPERTPGRGALAPPHARARVIQALTAALELAQRQRALDSEFGDVAAGVLEDVLRDAGSGRLFEAAAGNPSLGMHAGASRTYGARGADEEELLAALEHIDELWRELIYDAALATL
jgi:hypothetical protein